MNQNNNGTDQIQINDLGGARVAAIIVIAAIMGGMIMLGGGIYLLISALS